MPKKITVIINDSLDKRFRNAVSKAKGLHKGVLTVAVEEALEGWIAKEEKEKAEK